MKAAPHLPLSAICATMLVTLAVPTLAKPFDLPAWTPKPTLLSKLSPKVHFRTFLFRPSTGYTWGVRIAGMVDGDFVNFKHPVRPDNTYSSLQITYYDHNISKVKTHKALSELQKIHFSDASDVVLVPPKQGRINGLSAVREDYSCKRLSSLVTHGCYYIVTNPSGYIIADAEDDAPSNKSNLSLLETSVLTFEAASPPATPTVP